MSETATIPVEHILREELARGDVVISTTIPILRHLLANDDHALFSDEIVARVRGVISDLARQMLFTLAETVGEEDRWSFAEPFQDALAVRLMAMPGLPGHAHSLALEYQLAAQLARRNGLDPVLSPLLQQMIASTDAKRAARAMQALAAQSRFLQHLRRMELPLAELPGELFGAALVAFRSVIGEERGEEVKKAEQAMRGAFDEGRSRLGLIAHLLTGPVNGGREVLSVAHAGIAFFASALALSSKQDRALAVLSLNERHVARLAVGLRAAGLEPAAIEEELLFLHPDVALPTELGELASERAASLLADANPLLGD
jgi:hypothetical protein